MGNRSIGTQSDPPINQRGYVYFVRYGKDGPIKIGAAASPLVRFQTLQSAHWETLKLLGWVEATKDSERFWLDAFSDYRIRGEWFYPHPRLIGEIEKAIGPLVHEKQRANA